MSRLCTPGQRRNPHEKEELLQKRLCAVALHNHITTETPLNIHACPSIIHG
jgi:hypothetical protein